MKFFSAKFIFLEKGPKKHETDPNPIAPVETFDRENIPEKEDVIGTAPAPKKLVLQKEENDKLFADFALFSEFDLAGFLADPENSELKKNFEKLPAEIFLQLDPESLRTLFLIDGKVDFRGNKEARQFVGLGDFFPHETQFLRVDGKIGKRSFYEKWEKVGYLDSDGNYLKILGGEKIEEIAPENLDAEIAKNNETEKFAEIQTLPKEEEEIHKKNFLENVKLFEKFSAEFNFSGKNAEKNLQKNIEKSAKNLGVDKKLISAILRCESSDFNFGAVRPEKHKFTEKLAALRAKNDGNLPDENSPEMSAARRESMSVGVFQIMGSNFKLAGFSDSAEMFQKMAENSENQFAAFENFVRKNPKKVDGINLLSAMKNISDKNAQNNPAENTKNFEIIAEIYNGPNFRENNYAKKLEKYFKNPDDGKILKT